MNSYSDTNVGCINTYFHEPLWEQFSYMEWQFDTGMHELQGVDSWPTIGLKSALKKVVRAFFVNIWQPI